MGTGWRGLLTGALGLALLWRLVANREAAGRVSGLLQIPGDFASRFLDPSIPAIGAIRKIPSGDDKRAAAAARPGGPRLVPKADLPRGAEKLGPPVGVK